MKLNHHTFSVSIQFSVFSLRLEAVPDSYKKGDAIPPTSAIPKNNSILINFFKKFKRFFLFLKKGVLKQHGMAGRMGWDC